MAQRRPEDARARAFRDAERHTRRVRALRIVLPLAALLAIISAVAYTVIRPFAQPDIAVDIAAVAVEGDSLTMELPRLTGFNKKNEAYEVTASAATQRLSSPGIIDLTTLQGEIKMADDASATLRAAAGRFDSAAELLTLMESVTVGSSRGYSARMSGAVVDFKTGTISTDKPVQLQLTNGTVDATRMTIVDGGERVLFEGGVSTRFETRAVANAPEGLPPVGAEPATSEEPTGATE